VVALRKLLCCCAALWLVLGLVACASVLGIDERELDSTSFPVNGYEGCRPGQGCDGCIMPEHAAACASATGASVLCQRDDLGECSSCVCDHCASDMAACGKSRRCVDIWSCLSETRCDLLESSDTGCYRADACRAAIEDNGGLDGAPFEQAVAIRVCAVTSSCLSCLSPDPEPAASCSPENGCQGCGDCFQQCVCSGDTFSACQTFCGEDAPPSSCSEEDECHGCTRCFETCICTGGDFAMCTNACRETCVPATQCSECAGCVERCQCLGGEAAACEAQCAIPPGACVEASSGGAEACNGCSSCLADCTCDGTVLDQCLARCQAQPCNCADKDECNSGFDACLCDDSAANCAQQYHSCFDTSSRCDDCPCERCGDKYALCKDTQGCYGILTCMRDSDCQGPDCFAQCGGSQAVNSAAFAAAEALWACSQGQGCTCDSDPFCAEQCTPFEQNGVTIEACCVDDEPAPCGLSTRKYFPRGPACVLLDQPNRPDASADTCPSRSAPSAEPYGGACFEGCRREDGSCGYWDHITGLGCLDPDMFASSLTLGCLITR
jgi:hypothetical protein